MMLTNSFTCRAATIAIATAPAVIGSIFGVAGGGLLAYKMRKRVGQLDDFSFEPLKLGGMSVTIMISGWISPMTKPDAIDLENMFLNQWVGADPVDEQYCLRWESARLVELGKALKSILTEKIVGYVAAMALKQTLLAGLMAALAWPATLIAVADIIDNPWSTCAARAEGGVLYVII